MKLAREDDVENWRSRDALGVLPMGERAIPVEDIIIRRQSEISHDRCSCCLSWREHGSQLVLLLLAQAGMKRDLCRQLQWRAETKQPMDVAHSKNDQILDLRWSMEA